MTPTLGGVLRAAAGLALALAAIVGPPLILLVGFYELNVSGWQFVEVEVEVVDEKGMPAGPVYVAAFELADGGPRLVADGWADLKGVFKFEARIPRKLVAELKDGTRVYAPFNLWIIASGNDGRLGTLTQPLDPSTMKHPRDSAKLKVKVRRVEQAASEAVSTASACWLPIPYQEESWAWTNVLQVGVWDNINALFEYPYGAQIAVQSKERVWLVYECRYSDWYDAGGATLVTLDFTVRRWQWLQGRLVYTLQFELKYYFVRYTPPNVGNLQIEKVYAVDTYSDPRGDRVLSESWNGQLPGWSYYVLVDQGNEIGIPITRSPLLYTFSVGVTVTFKNAGVSVGLSVGKSGAVGTLTIKAGRWQPGYLVRVESSDGSYVVTRCNWIKP